MLHLMVSVFRIEGHIRAVLFVMMHLKQQRKEVRNPTFSILLYKTLTNCIISVVIHKKSEANSMTQA